MGGIGNMVDAINRICELQEENQALRQESAFFLSWLSDELGRIASVARSQPFKLPPQNHGIQWQHCASCGHKWQGIQDSVCAICFGFGDNNRTATEINEMNQKAEMEARRCRLNMLGTPEEAQALGDLRGGMTPEQQADYARRFEQTMRAAVKQAGEWPTPFVSVVCSTCSVGAMLTRFGYNHGRSRCNCGGVYKPAESPGDR